MRRIRVLQCITRLIVGGAQESVLVPAADIGALADAMERLASDRVWSRALGRAGNSRIEEFSARRMVEQIAGLYEDLLREGRAR